MKIKFLLFAISFQSLLFSQKLDYGFNMGSSNSDEGNAICIDKMGNSYVTGYFTGTTDFNPSNQTYNLTAVGDYDIFVAKYDTIGRLIWAKSFGGKYSEQGYSIQLDQSGNIFVCGIFQDTVDFDPSSNKYLLSSNSPYTHTHDVFVLKLDKSGNMIWVKSYGSENSEFSYSLCVDNSNNIVVSGTFMGKVDFKDGADTFYLKSTIPSDNDLFLLKLKNNGDFIFAKRIGRLGGEIPSKILTDKHKDIYVSGFFGGDVDFNPDTSVENKLYSAGSFDAFVLKLDSNGNYLWAKNIGGNNEDRSNGMGIDDSLNVYLSGYFYGMSDFNPATNKTYYMTSNVGGMGDIFVLKLDKTGNFVWAKQIGGSSTDILNALAVDNGGNIYGTGYFFGTCDFDPNSGTKNLTSNGSGDCFLFKLNSNGKYVWAYNVGNTQNEIGQGIAVDDHDQVFVTGLLMLGADFDISSNQKMITSNGSEDAFVVKYAFPPTESIKIVGEKFVCKNTVNYFLISGKRDNQKVRWQLGSKKDSIIYGGNNDTLVVFLTDTLNQIIATVYNKNYEGISDTFSVDFYQQSKYEKFIFPNDSICENTSIYFDTKGLLSAQWQDSISDHQVFKLSNSQKIYLSASDSNKCLVVDSFNITVLKQPEIIEHPIFQNVNFNSTATYICKSNFGVKQWQILKNNFYINLTNSDTFVGVNTDTLKINASFSNLDKSIYRCRVSSDSCVIHSDTAGLYINFSSSVNSNYIKTSIYPNPSNGIFYIDSRFLFSEYTVIDFAGKIVKKCKNTNNQIDLENLPDGIYFLQMMNNSTIITGRLVKSK